ncbi:MULTISPECIES: hypothetical protein [Burkholderia]|uniref:hypothetical protein n=1 Tax=Burkholderia TaxID=32008 RepID=UPI000F53EB43|nr:MULTISPECIES: hypothetical protein [Burkholderia]MBJ9662894.1 hypothetical protein [Burkholderia gladioli]MBJ9710603.1 hypothetical protein [Burkholderia gladioli]MBU9159611.1 hypothetical protein [Burkholderia gladioli]MBU9171928.1 hypothetical protein [Burkholderia gladioli]MBU9217845.1 hypothetical protein [Burkholderia gladioli]
MPDTAAACLAGFLRSHGSRHFIFRATFLPRMPGRFRAVFPQPGCRGRPSLDDIGSAITQFLTPFSGDSIGFRAFDSRRMRDLLVAFDKKWDFGVAENRRE